ADIPRRPASDEHTLEETKKWARSLVARVRMEYKQQVGKITLHNNDYLRAASVIEEMAETILVLERLLFLAEKAGVLKFNLGKLLVDFLGDVQIVAEFDHYRKDILNAFDQVMTDIHAAHPDAEIHIVAHSEGTVVTFLGLLDAWRDPQRPSWVSHV